MRVVCLLFLGLAVCGCRPYFLNRCEMIHCTDFNDVIDLFNEAERPLSEPMINALVDIDLDLEANNLDRGWVVLETQCRICNHTSMDIAPSVADLDSLECDNCGNFTAQEKDELEWWQLENSENENE